jgi:hypothetical protein
MAKDAVFDALKKATKGLLFPSESEAPVLPFVWDRSEQPTPHDLVHEKHDAGTRVEQLTLDEAFATVPREDRPRFDALRKVLESQLSGITVYKIGDEAEKMLYIVGKTKGGRWAGVHATVVET